MNSKIKTAISAAGLALALNACSQEQKTVRLEDWVVTISEDKDGRINMRMHPENMDGSKCYIEANHLYKYYNKVHGEYMGKFGNEKFHYENDPVCAAKVLPYKDNSSALVDIYEKAEKAEESENKEGK